MARTSIGSLSYGFEVVETGIFVLEINGGQHNLFNTGSYSFLFNVFVDGEYASDCSLSATDGSTDSALYSPQINSDEYLNNGLKQNLASQLPPKDKPQLDAMVEIFMLLLSAVKKHVQAFFHHPDVVYACSGV